MPKFVSVAIVTVACVTGSLCGISNSHAQGGAVPPAGSSLALTPPVDQRAKQFRALPHTQQRTYLRQGYKRHTRPY